MSNLWGVPFADVVTEHINPSLLQGRDRQVRRVFTIILKMIVGDCHDVEPSISTLCAKQDVKDEILYFYPSTLGHSFLSGCSLLPVACEQALRVLRDGIQCVHSK